jgi:hypothetical protein
MISLVVYVSRDHFAGPAPANPEFVFYGCSGLGDLETNAPENV